MKTNLIDYSTRKEPKSGPEFAYSKVLDMNGEWIECLTHITDLDNITSIVKITDDVYVVSASNSYKDNQIIVCGVKTNLF